MRRAAVRLLGVGLFVVALLVTGRGFAALCAGGVEGYRAIASARDEARAAGAASAPAPEEPTPRLGRTAARVAAGALDLALAVKQSDYVAFGAHALAAAATEAVGCSGGAAADQWRKAASHAWSAWPARVAADGLARSLGAVGGDGAVVAALREYAAAEPWHAANLTRVEHAYALRAPR